MNDITRTSNSMSTREICEQLLAVVGWLLMLIGLLKFVAEAQS